VVSNPLDSGNPLPMIRICCPATGLAGWTSVMCGGAAKTRQAGNSKRIKKRNDFLTERSRFCKIIPPLKVHYAALRSFSFRVRASNEA